MGRCHFHVQRWVEAINVLCTAVHQAHSYLSSPPHQLTAFKSIQVSLKYHQTKSMKMSLLVQTMCISILAPNPLLPAAAVMSVISGKCSSMLYP